MKCYIVMLRTHSILCRVPINSETNTFAYQMSLKNYEAPVADWWHGRVDDLTDQQAFRFHQVIALHNLNELPASASKPASKSICLLGYCGDEGITRNQGRTGAQKGPQAIRTAMASLPAFFSSRPQLLDAGNVFCTDKNMEQTQEQLSIAVEKLLTNNMFPIVLGGSHEIAYGHYNGISNYLKSTKQDATIGIINFDAHFDLRPYHNGSSSGTMFSQIADDCAQKNTPFGYMCLGIEKSGNTQHLFSKADSLNVQYILANEFVAENYATISHKIKAFIDSYDCIYITLCTDVFNAAFAPGVSALQPFGLMPNQVRTFIKQIIQSKKVISFDVAEVSPPLDQDNRTARLAAAMIYEVIESLAKT